jgi:hypothetical protein
VGPAAGSPDPAPTKTSSSDLEPWAMVIRSPWLKAGIDRGRGRQGRRLRAHDDRDPKHPTQRWQRQRQWTTALQRQWTRQRGSRICRRCSETRRAGPVAGGLDSAPVGDHGGGCVDGAGRGRLWADSGEGGTPTRGGEGGVGGGGQRRRRKGRRRMRGRAGSHPQCEASELLSEMQ